MSSDKFHLTNPRWQGISGILNAIAIIVMVLLSYLTLTAGRRVLSVNLLNQSCTTTIGDRINFIFDGVSLPRYLTAIFDMHLSGEKAIMPEDFKLPLTIEVPSTLRILAITPYESSVRNEWKEVSATTWELMPQLINPSESAKFLVILADAVGAPPEQVSWSRSRFFKEVNFKWTGRIINVPTIVYEDRNLSYEEDPVGCSGVILGYLPHFGVFAFINLEFWMFLALIILFMVSSCLLVRRQKPSTPAYLLLLFSAAHTILGILCAESVIWIAKWRVSIEWFSYVVIIGYTALTLLLVLSSARSVRARKVKENIGNTN